MASRGHLTVSRGEGKSIDLGGLGIVFKVWPEDTGGALAVVEHPIEPKRLVRPHTHTREDEISYVVEGRVGVRVGQREFTADPGTWFFKPRGVTHTFWNPTSEPARLIELITPGTFAHYFPELAAIVRVQGPPDVSQLADLDRKWGHSIDMSWVPELRAKYGLQLVGE